MTEKTSLGRDPNLKTIVKSPTTMWCKTCREDVPAIASFEARTFCCARCGGRIDRYSASGDQTATTNLGDHGLDLTATRAAKNPPVELDWQEDASWEIERVLRSASAAANLQRPRDPLRFDAPQHNREPFNNAPARPHSQGTSVQPPESASKRRRSIWNWLLVAPGWLAFACGGVLLGWALATGRGDLWNFGLPTALAGEAALVLGLLVQTECSCEDEKCSHGKRGQAGLRSARRHPSA